MGQVIANASMSLDGYIAKDDNTIGRLFDWLQNGEVEIATVDPGITFHLTPISAEHWRRWTDGLGALICGRTLFDFTGGWDGTHTMGVPVVVVTHQVPTDWVEAHPGAPFHFVTDGVRAAVAKAQEMSGPRTVAVSAGTIARQCLELGLLDSVAIEASLDIDDEKVALPTLATLASWLPEASGSDGPGEVPTQRSPSVDDREGSEPERGRAEALARLSMAAPIIAEARAATAPTSSGDLDRRNDYPDPMLSWLRAAAVLIPDSRAVQTVLHMFGERWGWENDAGDFGAEALRELIELLVELEQFDDAVAAASALSHPLSRAEALANLAPALPKLARSEAISEALSLAKAALESGNICLRQGFGFPGVELLGVTGLALQQHLLTAGQREQLDLQ